MEARPSATLRGLAGVRVKKEAARDACSLEGGGYLLSHFRSTIGVAGFNFSVRNGKRWSPRAITTLVFCLCPASCPAWHDRCVSGKTAVSDLEAYTRCRLESLSTRFLLASLCCRGAEPRERVRAISNARLCALLHLHLRPIYVVVYNDPMWRSYLGEGFVLRCFQHLS